VDATQSSTIDWRWRRPHEERGHLWEHGYRGDVLVAIRCVNCDHAPIEVMRENLSIEPCMGRATPSDAGS
jgi:hypothetical protein